MKKHNYIIIIVLLLLSIFVILLPEFMIRPGKLIDAHSELETNCFACHAVFKGAPSIKCISCHKISEIGIKTTEGQPIVYESKNVAFHQELIEEDCLACHGDHSGVMAFRPVSQFSHSLLNQISLNQCEKCHTNPSDILHVNLKGTCTDCHTVNFWSPSIFDHEKYFNYDIQQLRTQCNECHTNPSDALHANLTGSCMDCHTINKWVPSTFDHDEYFRFDRDHNTECITCHVNNNYTKYTCYGCHEHSRSKVRREHIEEGINNYENCVKCHRSGDEDEAERIWKLIRIREGIKFDKYYDDDHNDHYND